MFWLIAIGLIILVGVPMARTLRGRDLAALKSAEHDMSIFKDQLAEVERDLNRGLLEPAQADTARIEVARRLLAADKRAGAETVAGTATHTTTQAALGIIGIVLLGTLGLYWSIGSPGMPDMPLQARLAAVNALIDARPDQAAAEAAAPVVVTEFDPEHMELVEQLRQAVADNPLDQTGLRLLVDNEARLGNFIAARIAQEQLLKTLGDTAGASDFVDLGELMIMAAGGYVSPQGAQALANALRRNPRAPRARYYSGLALAQSGRSDVAYRMWAALLEEGPADAPWIPLIKSQIGQLQRAAKSSIAPAPAGTPGPSDVDIENASQMSASERQAFIRAMVSGLAERLSSQGGTAVEWARLIHAYGVLGEIENAGSIWKEAKKTFTGDAEAMSIVRKAADVAGVEQ